MPRQDVTRVRAPTRLDRRLHGLGLDDSRALGTALVRAHGLCDGHGLGGGHGNGRVGRRAACGSLALGGRGRVALGGLVAAELTEDSDDVARLALGAADHEERDEEEEGEDETEERHTEDEHPRLANVNANVNVLVCVWAGLI